MQYALDFFAPWYGILSLLCSSICVSSLVIFSVPYTCTIDVGYQVEASITSQWKDHYLFFLPKLRRDKMEQVRDINIVSQPPPSSLVSQNCPMPRHSPDPTFFFFSSFFFRRTYAIHWILCGRKKEGEKKRRFYVIPSCLL